LWNHGLNYGHGTGHGVGCYLPVHEGPQRIALGRRSVSLLPGMVVSNEPGYYKPGAYGIRIENLLLVTERPDLASHELGEFLSFSPLSLVPYCRRLVVPSLLSDEERSQINAYHRFVRESLEPLLPRDISLWLQQETAPV
jgi:Xaa-Pro aminopeptidase